MTQHSHCWMSDGVGDTNSNLNTIQIPESSRIIIFGFLQTLENHKPIV